MIRTIEIGAIQLAIVVWGKCPLGCEEFEPKSDFPAHGLYCANIHGPQCPRVSFHICSFRSSPAIAWILQPDGRDEEVGWLLKRFYTRNLLLLYHFPLLTPPKNAPHFARFMQRSHKEEKNKHNNKLLQGYGICDSLWGREQMVLMKYMVTPLWCSFYNNYFLTNIGFGKMGRFRIIAIPIVHYNWKF